MRVLFRKSRTSPNQLDNPHKRIGFVDRSIKDSRKIYFRTLLFAFIIITFLFLVLQSLYFGVYYRQAENTYRLTVLILNLDSAASTLSRSTLSPYSTSGGYTAVLDPQVVHAAQQYRERIGPQTNATYYSLGYLFPSAEQLSQFCLPVKNAQGEVEFSPGLNAST